MFEVKNLSVYFGKAQILHNVDLRVNNNEIVAIIGPNGSGKTVLLRTISGLLRPSQGEIEFFGERIEGLATHEIVKRGIAHCPERKKLFPDMTVKENVELGAYLRKDSLKIEKDLEKTMDLFPLLEERKNQEAKTLSGGEQQMLSIARAMMSNPKLLMLDEPSLGLAPLIREKLKIVIGEINKAGVSILIVEQDLGLALSLCSRGYVFEQGRVCLEGSGKYLRGNPRVKEAYLGLA
ncbi:MAG: ABC transporter ATP-binding protein [Candidatus Bathyarchaeota archaeon]|nr:ABC transporter ATP-binding protein [Candidatus Bathyarchaeota archaeon]